MVIHSSEAEVREGLKPDIRYLVVFRDRPPFSNLTIRGPPARVEFNHNEAEVAFSCKSRSACGGHGQTPHAVSAFVMHGVYFLIQV